MDTLSLNQKFERLNYESTKTMDEAYVKMKEFGKVMVVRPTGFGKTRMLVKMAEKYAKLYPNKKIAYIYPLDIIQTEIIGKAEYINGNGIDIIGGIINSKRVEFISYMKLTKYLNEKGIDFWYDYFKDNFSLIILDEVHCAGAEGFINTYDTIRELIVPDGIHMIGATATPNRMFDNADFNVLDNIFDGITVYKFELSDCFRHGLIPKIILATRKYNMQEIADVLKEKKKLDCKKSGTSFDEKVFNIELSKLLKSNGTEGEYIYKYLSKAGYNLASTTDKHFKFIVFFTNINDMADRGPEVESWFNEAFNKVAKEELGLRKDFSINSYYVASSKTDELDAVVNNNKNRFYLNKTKKLNSIESEKYTVDLLFTVNMINMGYHVEDITGIVMLRGTRSEVVYYQQLGRALSVKAVHNPIVYDMVRNKDYNFWFKKDARESARQEIQTTILAGSSENENEDFSGIDIFAEGDDDEFEDLLNRWSDTYYTEKNKIVYMYEDRKAPICVIATDINKKCTEVAEQLIKAGITLRPEDSMYLYHSKVIESKQVDKEARAKSLKIMKFLYSKKAMELYDKFKKTTQSLYDSITKIIKKR